MSISFVRKVFFPRLGSSGEVHVDLLTHPSELQLVGLLHALGRSEFAGQ